MTQVTQTTEKSFSPVEELEKQLEGAKSALKWFENGHEWSKANTKMWETHVKEAKEQIEHLQTQILKFEINDLS